MVLMDKDVRPALIARIIAKAPVNEETILFEELGICRGKVRVDIAVVNGIIHGYEIKSGKDDLRRLIGQVSIYSKVLDRATLVISMNHLDSAKEIVPSWWEVLVFQNEARTIRFKVVQRGKRNPNRDPRLLVEFLWLDEAIAMLDRYGLACGVRGKPRRIAWDRICGHFNEAEIAAEVRTCLKARINHSSLPQPS